MMIKKILFLILFGATTFVQAQVGTEFPAMEGESLTNEFVNLPDDIKGKYTIIGLAYSKKAEEYLKSWFKPAYYQFLHKPDKPSVFQITFDVNLYFVPMFTGAKRPAYKSVMKKVKETIDKDLQPYVLFYKGELHLYKEVLKFEDKKTPYFYVLDPEGKIIYVTKGRYSDSKMQEIVDYVADAMD